MMGSHQKYFCAARMVSILCAKRPPRLPGIEMLSGAELDFLSCHLPSLPSSPFIPPSLFLCSPFCLSPFFPAPHVRNAGSRSEFSARPVFPLPPSGCLSVSRCVGRVCLLVFIFVSPVSLRVQTCFAFYFFSPLARHSPVLNFEPNSRRPCEKVMCSFRLGIPFKHVRTAPDCCKQNNYSRYKLYIQLNKIKKKNPSIKKNAKFFLCLRIGLLCKVAA